MQHGQVFELKKRAVDGSPYWRTGPAVRVRDGCSEEASPPSVTRRKHSNGRSLLRRQKGAGSTLTLKELVEECPFVSALRRLNRQRTGLLPPSLCVDLVSPLFSPTGRSRVGEVPNTRGGHRTRPHQPRRCP
jgi:hypothetical protein